MFRITGDFYLQSKNELTDLGGFTALQTIVGSFSVNSNALTTLGDFSNLQSIGGHFEVSNNNKLVSLGNFPVLQTIGGGFRAFNNRKLTDLGDFPNLTSIGKSTLYVNSEIWNLNNVSIVLERNPNLVLCSWLQDFLPGGEHAVSGESLLMTMPSYVTSERK